MNFTEDQIIEELLAYIKEELVDSSVNFDAQTSLTDLGIDSMSVIQLVLLLERKFGIQIQEKDMLPKNFKSVKSLAQCAINS